MIKTVRYCVIVAMFLAVIGCKEELIGGMKLEEAFVPNVAEFVDAVLDSDYNRADKLLHDGVDINAVGKEGITPFLWLLAEEHAKDLEAIEYMLKKGANPNYIDPDRQVSAMYFAAGGNKPEFLELLIKYGGDVNQIGNDDKSMLMVAAEQGRLDNIKTLLEYGAKMEYQNRLRHTAATMCITPGRFDLVVYLLEHGFSTDLQGLGMLSETVIVDTEMQPYKEQTIDILRSKGVKFPASGRLKRYLEKHPASESEVWDMVYGRVQY
ncbi:ankyrin repeat domain-containing protein [Paraneptunicella aestuarii]|uniref:ankyrin repeat domain-containing protein n=1 Tax=Paraneptunicella aestuarii TaxID=2831148 RepID=UPI001E38BD4A|nr:ankyrin repeat domain-containing protein [Paraneptunicella aestuarii]UAA38394.1 ankyrin repeat domain-containing protein [Paraneptunicella aestuarii]